MKFYLVNLLSLFVVFTTSLALGSDGKPDAMVESIHFLGEINGAEVIQFRLNEKVQPKVFELDGEKPRIVFDFIKTGYALTGKRIINAGGDLVERLRIGIHNKPIAKTRVVIDIAKNRGFEIEQEYIQTGNVFEIRLLPKASSNQKTALQIKTEKDREKKLRQEAIENTAMEEKISPLFAMVGPIDKITDTKVPVVEEQKESMLDSRDNEKSATSERNTDGDVSLEDLSTEMVEEPTKYEKEIPVLLHVSYEKTTNKKEMVLFKMNGFHPPVVFAIEEDEPRIVCDFLDAQLDDAVEKVVKSGGEYIEQVRVSRYSNPRKVRVVLDLVADNNYDLKQVFFKEDDLFVVIISDLSKK